MLHESHDISRSLPDEAATLAFGASLAKKIQPGLVIYLYGDLGMGKTTLVRGLIRAYGYAGKVKSPTYTLVEIYELPELYVYHFDLYRMVDEEEWETGGFREYFNEQSVCLIEWPEKAGDLLPGADIELTLQMNGNGRQILCTANTELGKQCLQDF